MAYTQEQIDELRAAIAEGATTVSGGGRTVTYRSLGEMWKLLRVMEAEVSGVSGSRTRRTYLAFRRD